MKRRPPHEPDDLAPEGHDEFAAPAAPDPDGPAARPVPVFRFDPLPPFAVPIVWLLGLCLLPYLAVAGWFLVWIGGGGSEPSSIWPAIAAGVAWTLVCIRLYVVRRRRARRLADPRLRAPG